MVDIFKLFGVETKEDKYTFCLQKMLNDDASFKLKVGEYFGFSDDYEIPRNSFDAKSDSRKKITPDLILCNEEKIVLIEFKMFSTEGSNQTKDYRANIDTIKNKLKFPNAIAEYYFITLSGSASGDNSYELKKWSDFYSDIFENFTFNDECLEVIKKTILEQVGKYKDFENDLIKKSYSKLFNDETYWITPFSLIKSGEFDKKWKEINEDFVISNSYIEGKGHSEFVTNLEKNNWRIIGDDKEDNINLFIRIEWAEEPVVWLCWEYNKKSENGYEYIHGKDLTEDKRINLRLYKNNWQKYLSIKIPDRRADSLKALKAILPGDKNIDATIGEIKKIVKYYSDEIEMIIKSISKETGRLVFYEQKYCSLINNPDK